MLVSAPMQINDVGTSEEKRHVPGMTKSSARPSESIVRRIPGPVPTTVRTGVLDDAVVMCVTMDVMVPLAKLGCTKLLGVHALSTAVRCTPWDAADDGTPCCGELAASAEGSCRWEDA